MQTFTPHNYQKYCIQRAVSDDKLGLLLDMGLGKTVITLSAVKELRYNRFEISKLWSLPIKSGRGYMGKGTATSGSTHV